MIQNSIPKKLPFKSKVDIFPNKRKLRELISRHCIFLDKILKDFFQNEGTDTSESLDFQKRKKNIGNNK